MDELFAIDAQARQKDLSLVDRHILRLEKAKPLLEQINTGIPGSTCRCIAPECSSQCLQLHADAVDAARSLLGISGGGTKQLPGYPASVLPGLADFPRNRVAELTPSVWAARNSCGNQAKPATV
jgi:hypothetical protein